MIQPYKLIFVNISLVLIYIVVNLIIHKIFPNKKTSLIIHLLIIISAASISILRPGTYESGDFNIHVYRLIEFYKNLLEGYFIPSWAGDINSTYGLPLFIFNYNFPYYISSFFHLLGFSFINSIKMFLLLSMYFSGIFSYLLGRELNKKNTFYPFIFSIFYVFFPYHLVSTHFKITIGEVSCYTLIPLLFFFIIKYINTKNKSFLICAVLVNYFILTSHIYIGFFLLPLIFVFILLKNKSKINGLLNYIFILVFSLILSSYQWLPNIIYKPVLYVFTLNIDINKTFFPSFSDLLLSTWRYGLLFQGPKGEISYLIGYMHIFIIVLYLIFLKFKKFKKKEIKEMRIIFICLIIYIFLMLPYSKIFWHYLGIFGQVGPHRLLIIISILISIIAANTIIKIKNKNIIYIILSLAILSTILNWGQRTLISTINDKNLINSLPQSTYNLDRHFYAATIFQNPNQLWAKNAPKSSFILNPNIVFKKVFNSQNKHIYSLKVLKDTMITENTLFFPGWKAYVNKKEISIFPSKNGFINMNLKKGNYDLELKYSDTLILKISKYLSIFLLTILFIYLIINIFLKFPKVLDSN